MVKDLGAKLDKPQIESQNRGDPFVPWNPEVANATIAAFHAGNRVLELQQFVVVSSNGPVDSPQKLRRLADLLSIPEVIETNEAHEFHGSVGDAGRVSGILQEECKRLGDRTE